MITNYGFPKFVTQEPKEPKFPVLKVIALIGLLLLVMTLCFGNRAKAEEYSIDELANAIYKAENSKTHPYGILAHYKHTSARTACKNTILHALKDWDGKGDFISFLGSRYCPVGAKNDPRNLNVNWVKNVKHFLQKGRS